MKKEFRKLSDYYGAWLSALYKFNNFNSPTFQLCKNLIKQTLYHGILQRINRISCQTSPNLQNFSPDVPKKPKNILPACRTPSSGRWKSGRASEDQRQHEMQRARETRPSASSVKSLLPPVVMVVMWPAASLVAGTARQGAPAIWHLAAASRVHLRSMSRFAACPATSAACREHGVHTEHVPEIVTER